MNKKIIGFMTALALTVPMASLAACASRTETETPPPAVTDSIRLNSDANQSLKVGDEDKIIYDAKADGKVVKNGVTFTSSDPSVIKVDEYGNVQAVGVGTATVTLTLKGNDKITSVVTYTVTKSFFMSRIGYCNGNVDLSTAELNGWVKIAEGEQSQILVSECSQYWYFSTKIEHSGKTGQDSSGRWGVGSFLVDDAHELGNVMMWFGFQPTNHATKTYTPYVGGWRVMGGGIDPEIAISSAIADASTATFELIRYGVDYYCTVTVGNRVEKYVYSCPNLTAPTYPGIYSQRQELYVSEYQAVSGEAAVLEKLNNFQKAESVTIDGVTDKLFAGETYRIKATVLPETTFDKGVEFALKAPVEGVTVTKDGMLTIGDEVSGEVTVVATAESGENVTVEKTFTVSAKGASEHALFDTAAAIGTGYTLSDTGATLTADGDTYLPLIHKSSKWAVSFKSTLSTGSIGILSAEPGYFNYTRALIGNGKLTYGAAGADKELPVNTAATNDITFVRDGSFYLVVVNGRLVERFYSPMSGDTTPVLYGNKAAGTVTDVTLVTGDGVDEIIAEHPFTIGKYVTDNGDGSYKIAAMEFTDAKKSDINWPPVNNYANGLKFANTVKGDFTIEFDLIDVKPLAKNGKIDSKVLIYLKSETKTASIQLVFKSDDTNPDHVGITFCPNLNDATWTEYDTDLDFMRQSASGDGPVHIAIVKRAERVEFYVENTYIRQFEGNPGLENLGFYDANTECTPGIGTYYCGVTVSNVKLTVGESPVDKKDGGDAQ